MRARRALLLPFFGGTILTIAPGVASGQTQEFSVQRFEPAPGPNNFLGVETLRMDGNWHWSAGLFMNYSQNPFVVQSCISPTTCSNPAATDKNTVDVVRNMITWDLLASVSPKPWVQVGLRVPLSYVNGQGLDLSTGGPLSPTLHAFGVGDPDIEAKFRLFGKPGSPIVLGLAGDISFPAHSTSSTNFIGDSSPVSGGLRGIVEGQIGKFIYGANLRALFQEDITVGQNSSAPNTTVGSEFRYGVAAGYNVTRILQILAEGFGGTGFRSEPGTNSLEVDGALRLLPHDSPFAFTAGGGGGVLTGVGVPAWRTFLGVVFSPVVRETAPVPVAETDRDGDGISDKKDKCPGEPETLNGFQDADGCPDELPDRDHDGVPDSLDKCPDAGGPDIIRNPNSAYYGCPDRDHDGVPDYLDKCPDVPEPTDDLWDGSGCPHVRDTDKDGIPDDVDKCPTDPETYNGYQDADGCPDKGPVTVEITDSEITIHDRIEFAVNKDKIEGAKSFQVLNAVAGVLAGHKEVTGVEVQGHTDNTGSADVNRALSQKRAEAVMKYLTTKGIDPSRLTAKGFGPDLPIADNTKPAGRQLNRRVEFHIAKKAAPPSPAPAPAPTPAPAAPPPALPAKP
jgi:OOP family OmpA-OmpF porin